MPTNVPLQTAKVASGNYARENDLVRNYGRDRSLNQYNQLQWWQQYADPTYGAIARVVANGRSNAADRGFGRSGRMAQIAMDQPLHDVTQQADQALANLGQQQLDASYRYNRGRSDSATDSMAWGYNNQYYGTPDQNIYREARARTRGQIGR